MTSPNMPDSRSPAFSAVGACCLLSYKKSLGQNPRHVEVVVTTQIVVQLIYQLTCHPPYHLADDELCTSQSVGATSASYRLFSQGQSLDTHHSNLLYVHQYQKRVHLLLIMVTAVASKAHRRHPPRPLTINS